MTSTVRAPMIGAASILAAALLISFFCGYHAYPVPFAIRWQFTPLGLLRHFDPAYLLLQSGPAFSGRFELNFDYVAVFLKTCLLEAPFYFILLRSRGLTVWLGGLVTANFLTHPAVFFLFPWIFRQYLTASLSAEVFAPVIEALFVLWLRRGVRDRISPSMAALIIVVANLFSWQMGAFV